MSDRFIPIDGSVLLRSNGVFSEHQIYHNEKQEVYARKGNGYIRLSENRATSASRIYWTDIKTPQHSFTAKMGRLILVPATNVSSVTAAKQRKPKAA